MAWRRWNPFRGWAEAMGARMDAVGRGLFRLGLLVVATPALLGLAWLGVKAWGVTVTAAPQTLLAGGAAMAIGGGTLAVVVAWSFRPTPLEPEPRPQATVRVVRAGGIRTGHPWFGFLFPNRVTIRYELRAELHVVGKVLATYDESVHHVLNRRRHADLFQRALRDVHEFGEQRRRRWAHEWPDHDVLLAHSEEDVARTIASGVALIEDQRSR